ncbi:25202_t:CDS:1, partial [Gigaspora rosea]
MSNFTSRKNMYSLSLQEEDSSTKESWDDMVSQDKSQLLLNMSIQEIDNGQNNNKEHMLEISQRVRDHHSTGPVAQMTL